MYKFLKYFIQALLFLFSACQRFIFIVPFVWAWNAIFCMYLYHLPMRVLFSDGMLLLDLVFSFVLALMQELYAMEMKGLADEELMEKVHRIAASYVARTDKNT